MEHEREINIQLTGTPKVHNKTKQSSLAATFFITSERNANGILLSDWYEGEESSYPMEPGTTLSLKMRPEKYHFLHDCTEESSYYECIGSEITEIAKTFDDIADYNYGNCSTLCPKKVKKCSPFPFPNNTIPVCEFNCKCMSRFDTSGTSKNDNSPKVLVGLGVKKYSI